jgi:hypothetical protein
LPEPCEDGDEESGGKVIEFIPFGLLFAIPIGWVSFVLARRKGRNAKAWGLWMWALAAIWLGGAAALPSMPGSGDDGPAAIPVVLLAAGCFALQVVSVASLVLGRRSEEEAGAASRTRIVVLLAILGAILALSLIFAYVL